MSQDKLIFIIHENAIVEIRLEIPLSKLHCCAWGIFVLLVDGHETVLANDTVKENLECANYLFKKALANDLFLHESIIDIGSAYNNQLEGVPGAFYVQLESRPH